MTFSIRKLSADDWRLHSEVRLRALRSDPNVFGSNYESESKFSEAEWRQLLGNPDSAVFGVFLEERAIGTTAISIDRNDATREMALLWGSWLDPEVRRKGLSKFLYDARLEWAKEHPEIKRIIVSHRESNVASKFANQKYGFIQTYSSEKVWSDGVTEKEHHYELQLFPKG